MLNFKSTIIFGLLPISLCLGLGLIVYNMFADSFTPDQAMALRKLSRMIEICQEYSSTYRNGFGEGRLSIENYNWCVKTLKDPEFIRALNSLECFYENIDGAREDLLEAFESLNEGTTTGQKFSHNMLVISNNIKDIITIINNNRP